jgi:uncharacterized protein YkwD
MILKYTATVFLAAVLAVTTAVGISAIEPERAEAAGNTVKSCAGKNITLKAEEYRSLQLHNRERRERGLGRLCIHPQLQRAARAHSTDMVQRDYFSHNTRGRSETYDARLKRYGYTIKGYSYRTTGENIGGGTGDFGTPDGIFNASWMKSKDHRPNILNKRFREVGIGVTRGTFKGASNYTMYTVDFGARRK